MAIGNTNIAAKLGLIPEVNFKVIIPLTKGEGIKKMHPITEVWADYFFIAACYAYAAGDSMKGDSYKSAIKTVFPTYNPLPRFGWHQFFTPERDDLDNLTLAERYSAMRSFIAEYTSFSFESHFGDCFPFSQESYELLYR